MIRLVGDEVEPTSRLALARLRVFAQVTGAGDARPCFIRRSVFDPCVVGFRVACVFRPFAYGDQSLGRLPIPALAGQELIRVLRESLDLCRPSSHLPALLELRVRQDAAKGGALVASVVLGKVW